ncbi:MAG TPA: ABC transporter ATP-binding protein [Clostridiales bacterium]|jgi:ABC-type lipoprotein export system ATPase subunit|nr:ABC transporter ATP-binding protein [Clostridiales bacterium]
MAILKLNDVSYTYRNRYQYVDAVKNVTYEFDRGKLYAIIGKSGSGKTTLLSMLAGLDIPTNGEVVYGDLSTAKLNRDLYRRQDVAVIYQSFNLFPLLTVLENVMYPLELCGVRGKDAKKRAKEKIAEVGLPETVYRRFPSMLSGGEQQRVAIARALVSSARIILADEPTGNLDTENSSRIVQILSDLAHKQGYCVIIVTHDLSIADKADVVLRMQDGKIIAKDEKH